MAQIVIDIDDKTYKAFMELISVNLGRSNYKGIIGKCLDAIKHGKVLPKGHGDLKDADALIKHIKNLPKCPNGHSQVYDEAMIINMIEDKPTIIEADKN